MQGNGAANCFQRKKRNGTQCSGCYARSRPAPRAFGSETQCVIFQCLVCNPLVVIASHAKYMLLGSHSWPVKHAFIRERLVDNQLVYQCVRLVTGASFMCACAHLISFLVQE